MSDEAVPSASPSMISIMATNPSTLSLSWNTLASSNANGIVREYTIDVLVQDSSERFQYSTVNTSLILTELHPYYTYTVYIAAVTIGRGPFSSGHTIKMPQNAPSGSPNNVTGQTFNSTAVQVSWDPPYIHLQNGVITSYSITLLEISTNTTQFFSQNPLYTTLIISGLHPYYDYSISVAAYTVALGPASVTTVRTLQDVPSAPPQNLSVTVPSSTTALLQWLPPKPNSQNGIIQYYVLQLYNSDTGSSIIISSSPDTTHHLLSSLHPFYSYTCSIAAVTIGTGPSSRNVSFQMLEDIPSSSPTNIRVTSITSRNVVIMWGPPLSEHQNGVLTGYTVRINKEQSMEPLIVTTFNYLNISSLEPHTEYRFVLSASTSQGEGPLSNYTSFVTLQDAPTASPFNVRVIENSISANSFSLQWQSPSNEQLNGELIGYLVMVIELNTGAIYTNHTSTPSIALNYLHPYYSYNCSVAAVTVSTGPFSDSITIQTAQAAPSGPPLSFNVTTVSSRAASVVWNHPSVDHINGVLNYYVIKLYEVETSLYYTYHTSNTSLSLNNLHPYYAYSVSVAAVTVEIGPYSDNITFATFQDVPNGKPQNVTVTAINATSLQVQWSPIPSNMRNGQIISYSINVTEIESGRTFLIQNVVSYVTVLTKLHPYYNYKVLVAGSTVIGTGPYALSEGYTNAAAGVGQPRNISVNVLSSSMVHIMWLPPHPAQQNGPISYYAVSLYSIETYETSQYNTTTASIQFTGLHPFYNYECYVAAFTVGLGPNKVITFQMAEDVPQGSPQNLTVTPLNQSTASISWSPPVTSLQNGIVRSYTIDLFHNLTESTDSYTASNTTTLVITDLKPFSVYSISVAASTIGIGPFSSLISVTLPEGVPSMAPSQFVAEFVSNGTALYFSWLQLPIDEINGILLGYQLSCSGQNDHTMSIAITGTTAFLYDLHTNTHYTCQVCAYTVVGCGPSAIAHISTYNNSLVGPPHSFSARTTSTTIHLQWEAPFDPHFVILSYVVSYQLLSTSFSIETPRPRVTIADINDTSCFISSLLVSSVYHIEVFAVTKEKRPTISESIIVTTSPPELMSPKNLSCAATSTSSLYCTWLPSEVDLDLDFEIRNYAFSYRLADGFDYYPGYGTTLGSITILPSTTLEYSITGLQPYGGYIIELEASLFPVIESGYSDSSVELIPDEVISITTVTTTNPATPTATVDHVVISVVSSTSVKVSWKPPKRNYWNGKIKYYKLIMSHSDSNVPNLVSREILVQPNHNHPDPSLAKEPLENESHIIEQLEESFGYILSIVVTNAAGDSIPSAPVYVKMPQAAPSGPPVNITLLYASKSTLNITWLPPKVSDANGIITGYELIFIRIDINDVSHHTVPASPNYFYKQGLQSYEEVSFKIAARTIIGIGPFSSAIIFRTIEDVPSPPLSLEAKLFNNTSVQLKWDPVQQEPVTKFEVFYSGHRHSSSNIDGPHQIITKLPQLLITDLMTGYLYQFKVRAHNNVGISANATVFLAIPEDDPLNATSNAFSSVRSGNKTIIGLSVTFSLIVFALCTIIAIIIIVFIKKNRIMGNSNLNNEACITISNQPAEESLELPLQALNLKQEAKENEYEESPKLKDEKKNENVDSQSWPYDSCHSFALFLSDQDENTSNAIDATGTDHSN